MGFKYNFWGAALLFSLLVFAVLDSTWNRVFISHVQKNKGMHVDVEKIDAGSHSSGTKDEKIDINQLLSKANIDNGQKAVMQKCHICHSFKNGGPNKVGPNLYGIVGNKRAHMSTYQYSKAMKNAGGTWSVENLFHFLHKPQKAISGTKMSFAGIRKQSVIADVISFLNKNSSSPIKLETKKNINPASDIKEKSKIKTSPTTNNENTKSQPSKTSNHQQTKKDITSSNKDKKNDSHKNK